MDCWAFLYKGSYGGGLALVAARSKEEAVGALIIREELNWLCNYISDIEAELVPGLSFETDDPKVIKCSFRIE